MVKKVIKVMVVENEECASILRREYPEFYFNSCSKGHELARESLSYGDARKFSEYDIILIEAGDSKAEELRLMMKEATDRDDIVIAHYTFTGFWEVSTGSYRVVKINQSVKDVPYVECSCPWRAAFEEATKVLPSLEKISLTEKEGKAYISVSEPRSHEQILRLDDEWWDKKYIDLSDRNKAFDRIVLNVENILYKFTLYKDGNIALEKRETLEDGVHQTDIYSDYVGLNYSEMKHDLRESTASIWKATLNNEGYEVVNFLSQKIFRGPGDVPKEIFDVQKINEIINEFMGLNIPEISEALNKFCVLPENAQVLKRK